MRMMGRKQLFNMILTSTTFQSIIMMKVMGMYVYSFKQCKIQCPLLPNDEGGAYQSVAGLSCTVPPCLNSSSLSVLSTSLHAPLIGTLCAKRKSLHNFWHGL